jgi:putative transposase
VPTIASAPTAVTTLARRFEDATAVLALPEPYCKRLRTTNAVQRLQEEIRHRERVIRIIPNRGIHPAPAGGASHGAG